MGYIGLGEIEMFIVDSNQANATPKLVTVLEEYERVIVDSLDSADVSFIGRGTSGKLDVSIGVEIKRSPSDVLASLRDGRLLEQPERMLQDYDLSFIALVGLDPLPMNFETGKLLEWRTNRQERGKGKREKEKQGQWEDSPFVFHYVNSIFAKFEAAGGMIRHSIDYEYLAAFLLSLHSYWTKPVSEGETFFRKRHKFRDWKRLDNPLAEIYERMHIGIKRAVLLTEKFPTIEELVDASEAEIAHIPGFGRKTAKRVRSFIEFGEDRTNGKVK